MAKSLPWNDPNSNPLQDIREAMAELKFRSWQSDFPTADLIFRGVTMTDVYVALYPYSNTNNTNKYRVVKATDWQAKIDGEAATYPYTEYDNMPDALAARDRLNGVAVRNMHKDEDD